MFEDHGIMLYTNERVTKQPSLFEYIFSTEIWSIPGPSKDTNWDRIDLKNEYFSDNVQYTDEEIERFKL